MMKYASIQMLITFTNPTIYDVRRDLVPLPKLPHMLCSPLKSYLENVMMALHTGPKHVVVFYILLLIVILTAVAQWLRCCATNRKVVGSIPAGVSGFFVDIKSF
jgi:hypothetical protein